MVAALTAPIQVSSERCQRALRVNPKGNPQMNVKEEESGEVASVTCAVMTWYEIDTRIIKRLSQMALWENYMKIGLLV